MRHSERKLILNGVHRALQPAGATVPAFDRIINDRFLLMVRPVKDVAGAYLIAVPALDASIIN
jgi:hypothetical protein